MSTLQLALGLNTGPAMRKQQNIVLVLWIHWPLVSSREVIGNMLLGNRETNPNPKFAKQSDQVNREFRVTGKSGERVNWKIQKNGKSKDFGSILDSEQMENQWLLTELINRNR